ncbi:hypothetical protein ACJMK2_039559 [Sinanodonta woodiana]|uniref:Uncharacterized protein n=1 Tax=Sinanodonta woodiana TaxID=1069815 RepID=A0ABD3WFQ2_SINWO
MAGLYDMGEDTELDLKNVKSIKILVLEHNCGNSSLVVKINLHREELTETLNDPFNTRGHYEYNRLRSMLLTRLTLYNSEKSKDWVDPSLVSKIDDPVGKRLAGQYLLVHQPGKGGRTLVTLLII